MSLSVAGARLHVARVHDGQGCLLPEFVTNIGKDQVQADTKPARDRSAIWLRAAMAALGILSATAAVVSYEAQYKLIFAYKAVKIVAALQAGIPDVASLVFACLGIALALHGKRAIRARFLNVAAVATSIAMNALASSHGWKAMAVWTLSPIAYAVTSDTLIGVLRAYSIARQKRLNTALADDEKTPLSVVGGLMFWALRLALAPISTMKGFRTWVVEEAPVAPGRKAVPAVKPAQAIEVRSLPWPPAPRGPVAAISARPKSERSKADRPKQPRSTTAKAPRPQGPSKTAQLIRLAMDEHNLPGVPLDQVSRLATKLSDEIGLHPATGRRVLLAQARSLQNGSAK